MGVLSRLELRVAFYVHDLLRRAYLPLVARRADHSLYREWRTAVAGDPNPLLRAGAKYFSQFDEDGILLEILRRLSLTTGRFVELGVGDGMENNTLILLAGGWSGAWIGGEPLAWQPSGRRLTFQQAFLTAKNSPDVIGTPPCDVRSVDLDGNDYWITSRVPAASHPG